MADPVLQIDWELLRERARDAMTRAYAPYSGFSVGAAALVDDGRIVVGCNVENAGYGVTLCAECGLVSQLVEGGGGKLVAFACVDGHGAAIMPCGRCRQLLSEHGGPDLLVETPRGILPMSDVLPQAFGPHDLDSVREAHDDSVREAHDDSVREALADAVEHGDQTPISLVSDPQQEDPK